MNTREEWLGSALHIIRSHLRDTATVIVPDNTRVSCGFPGGASRKARGQCWSHESSADGTVEIFVSPTVADPETVLSTLVHEAIHAAVGLAAGHKAPFKKVAIAAGLEGKMTATYAGAALKERIIAWIEILGIYPHATLDASVIGKKQTTRLVKCECSVCGYIVRTTQKWIEQAGAPFCGAQCSDDDMEPLRMNVAVSEPEEG